MKLLELKSMPDLAVSVPETAIRQRDDLLYVSETIQSVHCEGDMVLAAATAGQIQAFCKEVESARVAINAPLLAFQRTLNAQAHELTDELEKERQRLNRAQGDYIQAQEAKQRSLKAAEDERLSAIEREREAKLAECDTIEARTAVQEEYSAKLAEMAPPLVEISQSVKGQRITEDIDFEVTNIWKLVESHPNLVKTPEPKRAAIKARIEAGLPVAGVRWWKKTSVTNIAPPPRMTITVPPAKWSTGITVD